MKGLALDECVEEVEYAIPFLDVISCYVSTTHDPVSAEFQRGAGVASLIPSPICCLLLTITALAWERHSILKSKHRGNHSD
jgi:hypothetical protein